MIKQFNFPTIIRFGDGAIQELSSYLRDKGFKRPLVVTDSQLATLDLLEIYILNPLKSGGFDTSLYSDFCGNPIKSHVDKGVEAFRNHRADCLVLIGGGAALDVGKAIGLMVKHPGDLFDYEDGKPDGLPADKLLPFTVAIPTTAGTGSEVGRSSVISDNITKAKKIIFAPQMLPNLVIADPNLSIGLPASVTAATGIDALTHLLEAYLVNTFHPMCDGIALEGVSLISKSLVDVIHNPKNILARGQMLMASLMGAVAFQKGLGVNHSCAHALSTVYDTHHGLANALMLKPCMEYNKKVVPQKFDTLARYINLESGDEFMKWIETLLKEVGINLGLKSRGITITEQLLDIAEADICHPSNPRPVSRDDFRKLFKLAL